MPLRQVETKLYFGTALGGNRIPKQSCRHSAWWRPCRIRTAALIAFDEYEKLGFAYGKYTTSLPPESAEVTCLERGLTLLV